MLLSVCQQKYPLLELSVIISTAEYMVAGVHLPTIQYLHPGCDNTRTLIGSARPQGIMPV